MVKLFVSLVIYDPSDGTVLFVGNNIPRQEIVNFVDPTLVVADLAETVIGWVDEDPVLVGVFPNPDNGSVELLYYHELTYDKDCGSCWDENIQFMTLLSTISSSSDISLFFVKDMGNDVFENDNNVDLDKFSMDLVAKAYELIIKSVVNFLAEAEAHD
jgi:hypothetical protein